MKSMNDSTESNPRGVGCSRGIFLSSEAEAAGEFGEFGGGEGGENALFLLLALGLDEC